MSKWRASTQEVRRVYDTEPHESEVGDKRGAALEACRGAYPEYEEFQRATTRKIPVVVLQPRE